MRLFPLLFATSALLLFTIGAANAIDVPVVVNPLNSNQGYMFDWIFFAIMIPVPALLLWDEMRNR